MPKKPPFYQHYSHHYLEPENYYVKRKKGADKFPKLLINTTIEFPGVHDEKQFPNGIKQSAALFDDVSCPGRADAICVGQWRRVGESLAAVAFQRQVCIFEQTGDDDVLKFINRYVARRNVLHLHSFRRSSERTDLLIIVDEERTVEILSFNQVGKDSRWSIEYVANFNHILKNVEKPVFKCWSQTERVASSLITWMHVGRRFLSVGWL